MWLISTFNPGFQKRVLKENIEEYGAENIIFLKKSRLFFWIKVLIPLLFWTTLFVLGIIFFSYNIHTDWFLWFMITIFIVLRLIPMTKVVRYYLDYKMDFIVVTPRAFMRYDQEGFFKTVSKTIDLKKIRSISVRKEGFFASIFNNGTLVVLSEGGEFEKEQKMRAGEIVFNYLYNPELCNEKINDLLAEVFTK